MNKYIRLIIAIAVLAAMVLLASNNMAWAGNLAGEKAGPQGQVLPASSNASQDPGSVRPPPVVAPPITTPGTYSVGGICTFRVITLVDTVTLHADLLPYATLGKRPQNIASYLAGVCRAIYVQKGLGVVNDLAAADGQVEICFAAVPNTTGTMYVYNDKTWTALPTTVQNGLACAPAQQTGKYVLVVQQ